MVWTIIGLLITAAVSIEGAISSERSRGLRLLLIGLALLGGTVAGVSAYSDNTDKTRLEVEVRTANERLAEQKPVLELINLTVGDLGTLNRLADGEKYYVRISAGSRSVMDANLTGIQKKFRGASSSGLLSVRKLRPDCPADDPRVNCWALVFGSNLNPAAAEVFERFANENGFPPPGPPPQRAEMQPEPHR